MNNEIRNLWEQFTNKSWINIKEYSFKNHNDLSKPEPSNNSTKLNNNTINPAVCVTGASDGSILEGFRDGSIGGIIKLHWHNLDYQKTLVENEKNKKIFSSCSKIVEGILNNSDYQIRFLNNLNNFDDFLGLTDDEKKLKLLDRIDKYPNHRDIGGNDRHWRIQVIRLPNKMLEDIDSEFDDNADSIIDLIINKEYPYWSVHDLVSLHTNCGSMSSNKQLMTFSRSAWKISNICINNKFNGTIIKLEEKGDIFIIDDITFEVKTKIFNESYKLGIKVRSCNKFKKDVFYLIEKILKISKVHVKNEIDSLNNLDKIKFIGVNVYKSLIQKLIRFQPQYCLLPDSTKIKSDIVLIYCMYKILISPPQYLPSLHRSVSGVENLTKRLAVIAFEDSDPRIIKNIHHLLTAALLSQRIPTWFPSKKLILKWFRIGLKLQNNTIAIKYKTDKDEQISFEDCDWATENNIDESIKKSAMLLRIIGSFQGDMRMIEYQVNNSEKIYKSDGKRPKIMLYPQHAFDQHVKANIALFLPDNIEYPTSKNIFGGRVKRIFDEVTSINPRRTKKWKKFGKNNFVKIVQSAQNYYLKLLVPPKFIESNSNLKIFNFSISNEWIAGLLGVFSLGKIIVNRSGVKISSNMCASLNPFNINTIIVTPKTSVRGNVDNIKHAFDQDMQDKAIKTAISILESGKLRLDKIKKNNIPIDIYNWYLKKNKDKFWLSKDGKTWVELENIKSYTEKFPINNIQLNINETDIVFPEEYKGIYPEENLKTVINKFSVEIRRRAISYIKHSKASFKMATISRAGGTGDGSDQISQYDSGAFKLFLIISKLNPYALIPSDLQPFEFKVNKTLMLRHVRVLLENSIKENNNYNDIWYNKVYQDNYDRKLYNFQEDSVNRLLNDHNNNKTRHFINIKVGLGKTLIVLSYLLRRGLNDIKYIVYTMPKSAYGSVIDEISALGFNINIYSSSKLIDPIWKKSLEDIAKNNTISISTYNKDTIFQKGCINIIEHDGLRKYKESLLNIISESIFIIDEVHKCLPTGTKRSGSALEISKLAKETIAFTGTPIINSKGAKILINWLEASVDFNLNLNNFAVATNSMIAYSVKTDVEIKNINIKCNLNKEEKQLYSTYIKKKDLLNIVETCYKACTRKMIELTINQINKGQKVFLVAKNKQHQIELANLLISQIESKVVCIGFNSRDKLLDKKCDSLPYINLTDKSIMDKNIQENNIDYDIVITRQSYSTGYNLTRLTCMITSVYFSSEPTREQLRGRINRLDQNNKEVTYITVYTGILELIHNNYDKVKFLSKCLQSKKIEDNDLNKLSKMLK